MYSVLNTLSEYTYFYINLVPKASFRYKRKAKKDPGTIQTRDQNLPK